MKTKKYQIVYWHVDNVYEHSCESGRWTLVFGNMWCSLDFMVYIVSDITHSTRTEILTHSTRISHIRNSVRPTFHLLRISHNWRLTPDGRGGRFNFPGQTCPDPSVTLIRRISVANDSDSPNSLARQILAIRRIHFRPQSKSKLRQYWRPSLLNCQSSLMQDTLDETFPNLLRLSNASPIFSSWGLNHQTSRLSLLSA